MKLLRLMDLEGDVRVEDGATHAIPDESTPRRLGRSSEEAMEGRRQAASRRLLRAGYGYGVCAPARAKDRGPEYPRALDRWEYLAERGSGIQSLERHSRRECPDEVRISRFGRYPEPPTGR